ncbi:MAG TPA: rhodanese-like domain-containing protein [Terriglobales bacterium]|nr:rhodanese-like domain-containing protein [Terriglobales bacterium]
MILETIKTEGLAHFSYLLGDEHSGMCAVIDPRRDVDVYLDIAQKRVLRISCILETHIHADFVSGSRELSARTGVPIHLSGYGNYGFEHMPLLDGDIVGIGSIELRVLHTPGHTPEHVSYLVAGGKAAKRPWGLFCGDTLFAGEVGRPDLLGAGTEERSARQLYRTLHDKVLALGDEIEIYPAHGQGSPYGGNIGERPTSTIGYERLNSVKLQSSNEDEFVKQVLISLPAAPFYYRRMKKINSEGPRVVGHISRIDQLDPNAFRELMDEPEAVIVDTREIEAFGGAHLLSAINIPLREEFPIWAGWMLRPEQRILLALSGEEDSEIVARHLFRLGYENIGGYLRRGIREWIEAGQPFESMSQMSVHDLKRRLDRGEELQLLDVRRDDEWQQGHIPTARHIYVPYLAQNLGSLDREKPIATYCGTGFRASIAASILQKSGFTHVYDIPGSMRAWEATGYPIEKTHQSLTPALASMEMNSNAPNRRGSGQNY